MSKNGIDEINREIELSPSQLITSIERAIINRWSLLVQGSPGIGKTEIIEQVAKSIGAELIISHPVISDPTDYKGVPIANLEDGTALFLPFNELNSLIHPKNPDKPLIYFCDDIGQAPNMVQAALMQLFLGRQINSNKVADNVVFLGATNRRQDKAAVSKMIEPLKSRFVSILSLGVDAKEWNQWAMKNNIPLVVRQYIKLKPSMLNDFKPTGDLKQSPSPRTIKHVADIVNDKVISADPTLLSAWIEGAAGEAFKTEFIPFLKIWKELPNPDAVLMKPDTFKVDFDSTDILFALTGALAAKATTMNMDSLDTYLERLSDAGHAEYSVKCMSEAMELNPEILNTAAFCKWAEKHNEIIGG